MAKFYTLTSRDGKVQRTVTDFPWMSPTPCPWNDDKYARVMIPFGATEGKAHDLPRQHIQVVRRDRLKMCKKILGN